jgi:hypothetical protein
MGARIVWGRAAPGLVLRAVVLAPQRPALAFQRLGAIPLAREVNLDGTSMPRGHLFVRKDARIGERRA